MDSAPARQRARIVDLLNRTGLDPTGLARAAGLSASTLTRFLNNPDHKFALRAASMDAVEQAAARLLAGTPSSGFAESPKNEDFSGPWIEWERLPEVSVALEAALKAREMPFGTGRLTKHAMDALREASRMSRDLPFAERCRLAVEGKAADLARRVD